MSVTDAYSSARQAPWPVHGLRSSSGALLVTTSAQTAPLAFRLSGAGQAVGENQYRVSSMVDTPKPHPEEAAQSAVASVNEAKLLNDIVRARVRFPQDVLRVEFRFGEDSAGAPAVWIVLVAHEDLKPSNSKIASLQRAADEVRSIVHRESNRWPYIEIATE
jgi:hypothetical protein